MNKKCIKNMLAVGALFASFHYSGTASAHFYNGFMPAKNVQVLTLNCSAGTARLVGRIRDLRANNAVGTLALFKDGNAQTATDMVQGDAHWSPWATLTAGAGIYYMTVTYTNVTTEQYRLDYHCADANGVETAGQVAWLTQRRAEPAFSMDGAIGDGNWTRTGKGTVEMSNLHVAPGMSQSGRLFAPAGGGVTTLDRINLNLSFADDENITLLVYAPRLSVGRVHQHVILTLHTGAHAGTDFFRVAIHVPSLGFNQWTFRRSDFTVNGAPNWQNINSVRIQANSHTTVHREIYFSGLYRRHEAKPALVISFDDGFISSFTEGHAYANPRGIPLTHAITPFYLGNSGIISLAQAHEMRSRGDAIVCHDAYVWTNPATIDARLTTIKQFNSTIDPEGAQFATWPEGNYGQFISVETAQAIVAASARHFAANRMTLRTGVPGHLLPAITRAYEWQLLHSAATLDGNPTAASLLARLDDGIARGESMHYYVHMITPTGTGPLEISIANWRAFIDGVQARVNAGLLTVLTFPEWYKQARKASESHHP